MFVNNHLIGQHGHVTWCGLVHVVIYRLWVGYRLARYVMTRELSIDMNIHVYEAYCHGYQIVYRTLEFRNRVRNWTSSKSVNLLARRLGGNKSTYDSANYHKLSSLSPK